MGVRKLTYKRVAEFFEQGDLVPFAVMTSAWHFIQALVKHGEALPIAIATGIFVDMLHFRTVRKAVDEKNKAAWLVAILTTAVSYAFHLLFYVAHKGPDGGVVYDWTFVAFFMALPLPIGIPILAWQQATKSDPAIVLAWRKRVKANVRRAWKYRKLVKLGEIRLKSSETQAKALEKRLEEKESELKKREERIKRLEEETAVLKNFNPMVLDIGRMMAGAEITQDEIAKAHKVSAATVSRLKSQLNGVS